ncbi:glycine--tRNA ligase subunit beta, partial [bacterium]
TYGHRFLSEGKIEVNSVSDYINKLKENKVILNNEERKELIKSQLQQAAQSLNAEVVISEELLDEVNQLVEFPSPVIGGFDDKYLEVPEIVNVTVMRSHQRYFPLFKDGKLLPNFITVSNMNLNPDNIRKGNQRVLKARLDDASFYYQEDLKKNLEDHTEELKRVTYFEEVGSIFDKTQRIEKIALELASKYFKDIEPANISRAAQILKSDLVTNMVKEFTELQGEIGYYYSIRESENEEISYALKEQYLPTGNNENFPSRPLSQLINFSDKLDNLVVSFSLGKIPTGSKDPFSLRRQSLGILKTCDQYNIPLNLEDALDTAFDVLSAQKTIKADKAETISKIKEFFTQRLKNDLLERGIRYDVIDSVLDTGSNFDNLYSLQEKARTLDTWVKNDIETIVMALARVIRISKEKPENAVQESLFEKDEEKALYSSIKDLNSSLSQFDNDYNYSAYIEKVSELVNPINKFFDNVMVMVEDQEVKKNRLALLYEIKNISDKVGNMDKLVFSA